MNQEMCAKEISFQNASARVSYTRSMQDGFDKQEEEEEKKDKSSAPFPTCSIMSSNQPHPSLR